MTRTRHHTGQYRFKIGLLALLGIFFLWSGPCARAETDKEHYPIGQLVALEGRAFYAADDTHTPMKLNDPVFLNTTVETGPESKALIMFVDNTEITLGPESEILIDEYVFDPYDAEENKGRFEMTKGAFLWVSGLLSKRTVPDVAIKTKVGSIGIRGTKFWGGNVETDLYGVYVFDGLIHYTTQNGQVLLPKDHGVMTGGETAPLSTKSWPANQLDSAVQSVTFSHPEEVAQAVSAQKEKNIAGQHDYRGRMFPYKPNPLAPHLKDKNGKFFSDEFEKFKDQK